MAARYVRIGQYPDYRDEIRGTLLEILASTANPGTYAAPEDVAGCTLEMGADGLWTGNLGTLTQAQADALVAADVMGNVKAGTLGTTAGTLVHWDGLGWWAVSGISRLSKAPTNIPSVLCWYHAASLAQSDGTAVSTLADSSGKNGPAVQSVSVNQPIYSVGGFNNSACMIFDGTKFMTFSEITNVKTLICVCQFDDPQVNDYAPIIGSASAYDFAGTAKTQPYLVDRLAVPATKLSSSIRVNGIAGTSMAVVSRPIAPSIVTIRLSAGNTAQIGNIARDRLVSRNFAGRYASVCAFSETLSDDDCLAVESYLASQYHITLAIKPRYTARANSIFWGDSMTYGQGATLSYPTQLATALGGLDKITIENLGASGTTAQQWDNAYVGQYMENFNFKRQCLCAEMVIHVWLGTNDLFYSTTPENTYKALKSLWARARAYGARVIAYTITPRSNSGTPAGFEAARQSLNTLIRSQSWRYDYLVDVGADSTIGAVGSETNATYYQQDLVHLTNEGLLIIANLSAAGYTALKL